MPRKTRLRKRRPLRLDLIVRTSERRADGQSPAQQQQQAEAVCATGGHEIVAVHDSGKSESGKTMDRAAVRVAQERIRAGETDGIAVGYLDRLGRAPIEETMTFIRTLTSDGGVLVAADWGPDPIDLTDPNVEDMLVFRCQMNRSQWNKAKARYALSQRNAVDAGKFIGPTPLGYRRELVDGKPKGRLYPDPKLERVIRTAYRRAARDGIHAAIAYLAERVPERAWTTSSVRRLLRSRAYLGEVWAWVDGERRVREGAHKPLTTLEDWTAAQTAPRGRRTNGEYPLTNIAVCAACGEGLTGQLQTVPGRGVTYRRYRCSNRACGGGSSINADTLEAFVRDELAGLLAHRAIRERFTPVGVEEAREKVEQAKAELDAYQIKTSALSSGFQRGAESREQAVRDAQARYDRLAGQAARSERLPGPEELHKPERFQRALAVVVDRIMINRGRGAVADVTDGGRVDIRVRGLDRKHVTRMLAA